jgi:hypothetical protein
MKAIENDEYVDAMEAMQLVRDLIHKVHGIKLTIKQVAKRFHDIKEGLEPDSIKGLDY